MEKLFKQFEVWGTKFQNNLKKDEFIPARLKLTFFYSSTVALILAAASFLIYRVLISNLVDTLREDMVHPAIASKILSKAEDIIQGRLLTIDLAILFVVVIFGFFLTAKTLEPIEKNIKKQKKFITDASHELRTPVAVVISGIEVALRSKDLSPDKARSVLVGTLEEMKEFSVLTNNLLDISKDFVYNPSLENVDMRLLVTEVVAQFQNLALEKNISINTELNSTSLIRGNPLDLKRVLYNILANAVTYSSSNSSIEVTDKEESSSYILTIEDHGVGMDKDVLEKVFEPFFRGDSSRSTPGAGLGLTLSKKIIEQHQGSVVIESKPLMGTKVVVQLPLS